MGEIAGKFEQCSKYYCGLVSLTTIISLLLRIFSYRRGHFPLLIYI